MSSHHRAVAAAELGPAGVDEEVQRDAARRLDQHDVALAEARPQEVERGLAVAGMQDLRRREPRIPWRRPQSPSASSPTTTSRSTTPAAAAPTSRWPATWRVAQLEHLAEHRHAPAGQPGEQVERGGHRAGRRVVAVVEDRHAAGADQLPAMRRRPAAARPRRSSSRSSPAAMPDGGRGERVVDRQAAERGIVTAAARPRRRA